MVATFEEDSHSIVPLHSEITAEITETPVARILASFIYSNVASESVDVTIIIPKDDSSSLMGVSVKIGE